MIKLNGYYYTEKEVEEALKKKGYEIKVREIPGDRWYDGHLETYAVKPGDSEWVDSRLETVARREFEIKPKLI